MTESNYGRHRGGKKSSTTQRRVAVALLVAAVVGSVAATAWAVSSSDVTTRDEPSTTLADSPAAEDPPDDSADDSADGSGDEQGGDQPGAAADAADGADDDEPDTGEEADGDGEPTPTTPAELVACEDAVAVAEDTISAARSGIGHWNEHINARTDLLAGEITIEETNAIFKRTRRAGPDDIKAFNRAHDAYADVNGACADVAVDDLEPDFIKHAEACLARADAADAAVSAAADVIGDWRSHLAAMRAHADGDMTSTMARNQWIEAWRAAPPVLDAFADRDSDLEDAPACA